jgi:hypothetical protein
MASSSPKINLKTSTTKTKPNLVYASNQTNKTQPLIPSLFSNLNNRTSNKIITTTINNNTNSSSSSTSSSSSEHPSSLTINPFPMIQKLNNMTHRNDYLVILDHEHEIEDNTPLTTEEEFKKLAHFLYIYLFFFLNNIFN